MKTIANILFPFCLLVLVLLTGCETEDMWEQPYTPKGDEVAVNLSFYTNSGKNVVTRAGEKDLMNYIDDVHILIFKDKGEAGVLEDGDSVVIRDYIQYGVEQKVYLRSNTSYYIFAAANIDPFNSPTGNAATYFNDVKTYGQLKSKYVIIGSSLIPDKLIMTTDSVVKVKLPYKNEVDDEVNMRIPLSRVHTQLELNIYNRVNPLDTTIVSGVYPVSFTGLSIPMTSHLMKLPYDHSAVLQSAGKTAFTQTQTYMLPKPVDTLYVMDGKTYTLQTVRGFIFENHQGDTTGLINVYDRRKMAPANATIAQITSNTDRNVLLTYMLPGKGRDKVTGTDVINNFDIDRNCIYHLNVIINSADTVQIKTDTRREFLDQLVVLTLPDMRRVDAHYMDIPTFLIGKHGRAKFESYTCEVDANGDVVFEDEKKKIPKNMQPMGKNGWLRFSWNNPFRPSTASNIHYAGLTDATTGATPILHFDEFIEHVDTESKPLPPKRSAVIRIGYVSEVGSNADYETAAASGGESVFYMTVSQWGLRTVGQVGGYDATTHSYASLLGVESTEENRFGYYLNQVTNNGPTWNYSGQASNTALNTAYDGKTATKVRYDAYRNQPVFGGVPPARDNKRGTDYDPVYNTFAADYCMRKNRDEDGNGIIEGNEIKWYLPTPVQLMQISLWRSAFNYSFNISYVPFITPYWSTNEVDASTALALDFSAQQANVFTSDVTAFDKTTRYPVRCVRDIPGKTTGMIYKSGNYLAGNIAGHLPSTILGNKTGWNESAIVSLPGNATMQTALIISRYYVRSGNTITTGDGGGTPCSNYSEPDYPAGVNNWRLPTQRELSFLYAYVGMIDNLLLTKFGAGNYDPFQMGFHWTATNDGNGGHFWGVNFQTGASAMSHKNKSSGYYRCVRYISTPLTPDP